MKTKKTKRADLENKRGIFFQIGLIITLGFILAAFEWSSSIGQDLSYELIDNYGMEEEIMQLTREKVIKPPPPVPQVVEVLTILDDDEIIDNELLIEGVESDQEMIIDIETYIDDEDNVEDDAPFILVADMPSFQGEGLEKFRSWVMKNLKYPKIAVENGISGKVYVQFVVNARGRVENAVILRGVDPSINQESIRVVMSSPKWAPGKQGGKAVRVQYTLPIHFLLK
jgi:periplasmic protein TonB